MVSYLAQFMRTGNPNRAQLDLPEWKAWSNHVGGPKAIQLDADPLKHQIAMTSREVSIAGVRYALDAEPSDTRSHVLAVLSVIQSFALYDRGDYEYMPGR